MKRFGQVQHGPGSFRIITDGVVVSRKILEELCNRLEARIPNETRARFTTETQAEVNERIFKDNALIDSARKVLRP